MAIKRSKRKNINSSVKQVDGKLDTTKPLPRTVDELLGKKVASVYDHTTETSYSSYLNSLNKVELWEEALKVGLKPYDNVAILRNRLKQQFIKYNGSQERVKTVSSGQSKKGQKIPARITKFLTRGK